MPLLRKTEIAVLRTGNVYNVLSSYAARDKGRRLYVCTCAKESIGRSCSHETSSAAEEAGNTKELTVNEKRLRKGFYNDAGREGCTTY